MRFHRTTPVLALLLAAALGASPALADPAASPPPSAPSVAVSPAPLAPTAAPAHVPPGTTEGKLPPHAQQKPAMVTSGIVVTVIGAGLLAGGAALVAEGKAGSGGDSDSNPWPDIMGPVGVTMLLFGAIHAVVGVSLISVGAGSGTSSGPRQAPPQVVPAIAVGPRSVTMRWVF